MTFSNDKAASVNDNDPLPNPEPAAPSLPEPDPGVFHHEIATQSPDPQHSGTSRPDAKS